jgi:predicted DNA-binding transcriptional regulator AlpA
MEKLTINSKELAAALGVSSIAIRRHRAGIKQHQILHDLPEPIATRPKLVWWRGDIEAWIESRRTFIATGERAETPTRRRGRPRKEAI